MLFSSATYIGIDPTAGVRPFPYVALDNDLRLLALGQGNLDEVLAFAGGQRQAVVGVCAPRKPNQGVMGRAEIREQLSPPPRPGRWQNLRLAEYILRQHNISTFQTAADEDDCPQWMQLGFQIYRRLEGMGYVSFPAEGAALQYMEVYPHACFTVMLGRIPFPKHILEGRIQRQLILFEQDINVPDPMRLFEEITRHKLLQGHMPLNDLYLPGELDALVAAFTAWKVVNKPDEVIRIGEVEEGEIVLPVKALERRY